MPDMKRIGELVAPGELLSELQGLIRHKTSDKDGRLRKEREERQRLKGEEKGKQRLVPVEPEKNSKGIELK